MLQKGAGSLGISAILKQGGHVTGYAIRSLNKAEQQYSVIQKGCIFNEAIQTLPTRKIIGAFN